MQAARWPVRRCIGENSVKSFSLEGSFPGRRIKKLGLLLRFREIKEKLVGEYGCIKKDEKNTVRRIGGQP